MTLQASTAAYLTQCRQALAKEQSISLSETGNWSHVDKQKVHVDWDILYKEMAPLIADSAPSSREVQSLMAQHHEIAKRFYSPTKDAYIGMALFYQENPDMNKFHNSYHPNMVNFLGEAIFVYANKNLSGTSST